MKQIAFILTISLLIISCGQTDNKQKELELKERELAIKEKELALKEKDTTNSMWKENQTKVQQTKNESSTKTLEINNSDGYNFENHNDIKVFISDLAKAIISDDKGTVAKMVYFPFKDGFRDWLVQGMGEKPNYNIPELGCNNENQFMEKYSKIFLIGIKKSIEKKEYRGYDNSMEEISGDIIEKGEFVIGFVMQNERQYSIAIKKINGKFKLHRMVWSS